MKCALIFSFLFVAAAAGPLLHAQPKRAAKAFSCTLKKQKQVASSIQTALTRAKNPLYTNAALHLSPDKRQKLAADLLKLNAPNMQKTLLKLQSYQNKYGYGDFFERFITLYYERHFGRITPAMSAFFVRINALKNPALQQAVALRLEELARNKAAFLSQIWQQEQPPFVRVIYLPELTRFSAASFRPQDLIYSCEINVEPGGFLPLEARNEISIFILEGTPWHIAGFSAGLEYLPDLYRFLITNGNYAEPFQVIWEKSSQSLLLSSLDNTRQLRVSRHEYHIPHRLHLHMQYWEPVSFINIDGKTVLENILLNIAFPIENISNNPRVALKDWFVTRPAQKFLNDPNANVIYGKIF